MALARMVCRNREVLDVVLKSQTLRRRKKRKLVPVLRRGERLDVAEEKVTRRMLGNYDSGGRLVHTNKEADEAQENKFN
jgi:hypothetical protein